MPKLSLLLGRRTVGVYDLQQPAIRIGRAPEMDIAIDNVSVSREHAKVFRTEDGWSVKDSGSANGTFVNGERLEGDRPLGPGDEISIGKFSIFFEKVVGDAAEIVEEPAKASTAASGEVASGTMYIRPSDVKEMLKSYKETREAHIAWKAGEREGTHPLDDAAAILVGQSPLCDLRVPKGPKHHILIVEGPNGYEVRNLSFWQKMRVDGSATRRARLSDGSVIEVAGLELRFMGQVT